MYFSFSSINKDNWEKVCAIVSILLTLGLFLLIFCNLDRGFNFNDESMYIYSIMYPERLYNVFADFGAFLHPIFVVLGEDLYIFRLVTFFSLIFFSALLILSFALLCRRHVTLSLWTWGAVCSALWCCTLGYYTLWLPTGSYNTLALIGIFGVLTALNFYTILCRPYAKGHFLIAWNKKIKILLLLCLAFFGVIAFIGKPTTAAALGILACIWLFFTQGTFLRKERRNDIILAAIFATIILLLYLFTMSNGLDTIYSLIVSTKLMASSRNPGEVLYQFAHFFFPISYVIVLVTWPLWAIVLWAMHKERYALAAGIASLTMLTLLVGSYIWIVNYIMALALWPLTVMVFIGACLWRKSKRHLAFSVSMAVIFFISVFVYHAGSNTFLSFKMSEAFILPALCLVSLCMGMKPARRKIVLPSLAIILCIATLGALFYSIFEPTRHNGRALWELTEPVTIKPNTQPILVHPERKAFIDWLRTTAKDNDWKAGSPLLSTSYYTTSAFFLINAHRMAAGWGIDSAYTASIEYYKYLFSFAKPEDLQRAWIIKHTEDGPRYMPTDALKAMGLNFPEDYELLSTSPPETRDGVWPADQYEIWKPKP